MASLSLLEASVALLCFLIFHHLLFKKPHDRFLKNWPVLGMLPGFLIVLHRIYDFSVEVLEQTNLTFPFKGPWFTGMDILVTVDPANIHYILSSNFSNYTKGADFKEVFDVFGEMIFNSDGDMWRNQRRAAQYMLNHQGFQKLSMSATRAKLDDGLVPLFDRFSKKEMVVDLQNVFQRFTFDTTFVLVTGFDPKTLSVEMPEDEYAKALDVLGDGIFFRHVVPKFLWKLQKWIGFGQEKRTMEAGATFDRVSAKYISAKRKEMRTQDQQSNGECHEDLLTSHMKLDTTKYEILNPSDDKFLRDTILAFNLAGRDTTASALSWFFWLLSENPRVVTKIRQEIITNINLHGQHNLDKLVYLQAALYESMRLYPPVPFQRKSPIKPDLLPSGHKVDSSSTIMIFLYALGRMRAVWGEDAMEFKPERWVSQSGCLRHEPSFKFLSFNAGPRTCPGKQLALTLMKTVAVEILQNYDIKVIKGQKIEPDPGLILYMKHGLRRCSAPRDGHKSTTKYSSDCDPTEQFNKLVYLHAALCETMRLYPPVPIERVSPVRSDVLPSGHKCGGEDASEFKPERWISETGVLRHEPSFKLLAFNAGPRTCLGKKMAMVLMKAVVVEILQNF
ncbi:hypothetical protein HID58_000057 [Brassica napus]|uniref:Alkane hydroxylase MAH1-like n=1 Tax=Brassica napus TaxID=3708 RepID=A0ABQ8EII4_BRANA|nr:hypothetical protein HID58_000057 [Brassica napus]